MEQTIQVLTTRETEELEADVKQIYPYETPEILAMPVAAGNAHCLRWLQEELRQG